LVKQHLIRLSTHHSGQHTPNNYLILSTNTTTGKVDGTPLWIWDVEQVRAFGTLKQLYGFTCCKGQATSELTPFKRVIGVDPSANMIDVARQSTAQLGNSVNGTCFEYINGNAENLPFLEDGSVDLITAGVHMS
jgi:SAM-dependent methyltransferase